VEALGNCPVCPPLNLALIMHVTSIHYKAYTAWQLVIGTKAPSKQQASEQRLE